MQEKSLKIKIKEIFKKNLTLISIVLGLFVALGLKLVFVNEGNFLGFTERASDMIYLIFIIGICVLIYYNLKIKDKRLWITSIFVGVIFAICYYLGDIQNKYITTYVPTSKKFMLYSFVKLITYFIIFTNAVALLFSKLSKLFSRLNNEKNNEWKFFSNNKQSFIIVALIFFISYIPFFLHYYPGNVNTDSVGSLYQIEGISKYTNFQPLLYTLLLGMFWNLGKIVFGSSIVGIALYTIFQMICTSLVFSTILYYMAKRKVNIKWRFITFLFLLLNPLNGWFTIRVEKGMLFHLSMILVIIGIIDIIYSKEKFFECKWKPILLAVVTLFMVFIRNNGIYSLVLTLPFLIWGCKKIWKKIVILFGTVLIITFTIQGPIFKMLDIAYSKPGEILSIPMQQYARIVKFGEDRLTEKEREVIKKYFPVDSKKLSDDYVPWKSDATKMNLSAENFAEDKITFIMQYLKFAFKFPVQTVSSIVFNTGNNYSPNFTVWGLLRFYGTETDDAYGTLGGMEDESLKKLISKNPIKAEPIVHFDFLDTLNSYLMKGNVPVISNLFDNIGFYFWMLVLCFAYCIYKKQYKDLVMLLPIIGLWITTIAAPMVDLRYIYPMFLSIPIYIGIIMKNCEKEKNKN